MKLREKIARALLGKGVLVLKRDEHCTVGGYLFPGSCPLQGLPEGKMSKVRRVSTKDGDDGVDVVLSGMFIGDDFDRSADADDDER